MNRKPQPAHKGVPHPGRPTKSEDEKYITKREYIRQPMTLCFASIKEKDDFNDRLANLKSKKGFTRNDRFFMQLMEDENDRLKKEKEEKNNGN